MVLLFALSVNFIEVLHICIPNTDQELFRIKYQRPIYILDLQCILIQRSPKNINLQQYL